MSAEKLPQQRECVLPTPPQGGPVRRCTSFHDYCSPRGERVQCMPSGCGACVVALSGHLLVYRSSSLYLFHICEGSQPLNCSKDVMRSTQPT